MPRPLTHEIPLAGHAVLVRHVIDGRITAVPGLCVSSHRGWKLTRIGYRPRPYRQINGAVRIAVAVELEPGQWTPLAVHPLDVCRLKCPRLTTRRWVQALATGLPYIRAALYSKTDQEVVNAERRPRALAIPHPRRRRPVVTALAGW